MSGTGGGAILEGSASSTASRPKNVTGGSVRRKNPAGGGKSVTKAGAGGDGTLGERVMVSDMFSLHILVLRGFCYRSHILCAC